MQDYRPAPDLLKDRVILVTGAGDGLGRAAAKSYAAHGATVVLLGRTIAKLEEVYDEIEQAGGPQPAIFPINLEGAAPKDYEDLANALKEEFGRLDGILHNAAIITNLGPMQMVDIESWYKTMQINLNAPYLLTQACFALLKASEDASIIFTNDRVGRKGKAYWGAYGVAKFAINGFMQTLADELDNVANMRSNCITPVATRTNMRYRVYPAEDQSTLPEPDALMHTYLYLMGPDSRDVNGQDLDAEPLSA